MKASAYNEREIAKFIANHSNPMRIRCATCYDLYGNHSGLYCQKVLGGKFVPIIETPDQPGNPNWVFKKRRR